MTPDNRALWELVESGDMAKLLSLARRTLHFAYVWNDHNFGTPKGLAKDTAIDAGLFTLDEANDFLEKIEAILERPVVVGDDSSVTAEDMQHLKECAMEHAEIARHYVSGPYLNADATYRKHYNFQFAIEHAITAIESMVRGKS